MRMSDTAAGVWVIAMIMALCLLVWGDPDILDGLIKQANSDPCWTQP